MSNDLSLRINFLFSEKRLPNSLCSLADSLMYHRFNPVLIEMRDESGLVAPVNCLSQAGSGDMTRHRHEQTMHRLVITAGQE